VPDDPDIWINLGDAYFHDGAIAGIEQPYPRAAEALSRALALDSAVNVEPVFHLLQVAGMERDTTTVRRLINRVPNEAPQSALLRLEAGAALGDSAMLARARPEFDSTGNVSELLQDAQLFGFAIQEAERSAAAYLKRPTSEDDLLSKVPSIFGFYLQLGRPAAATAALARLGPKDALPARALRRVLMTASWGYLDSTTAAEALARLGVSADGPVPTDPAARFEQYQNICVVQTWRLTHGDTRTARAAIPRLADPDLFGCHVMLEALLAAAEHRPDAAAAYGRLDSLLLLGGKPPGWVAMAAKWHEAQGDTKGALRTIRRRAGYDEFWNLSYLLREEGRLAALLGERQAAIKAYTHYLALRYNPEPSVIPEVDLVRADLAQLLAEVR